MADELQYLDDGGVAKLLLIDEAIPKLTADPACCCSGAVLYWNANSLTPGFGTPDAAVYLSMGLTVHTDSTWSGSIADYKLIFWGAPTSDPSWWSSVTGGTWEGRLVMVTDFGATSVNSYLNSIAALTGMTNGPGVGTIAPYSVEADPLTAGVAGFTFSGAQQINGGTPLSLDTGSSNNPLMAHNKPLGIDYVIAGDATTGPFPSSFCQNLWNVPL